MNVYSRKAYSHVPDSVNKINKNGLINEKMWVFTSFFDYASPR